MPKSSSCVRDPVIFPATVFIDNREQAPFAFEGLAADTKDGGGPLVVRTTRGTLTSGDYSLVGLEGLAAVERKSPQDLFGTIGQGRERFERELARLDEDVRHSLAQGRAGAVAAVVCECEW